MQKMSNYFLASSENQTPKTAFGFSRSPNLGKEFRESDRSRKASFRQAVTPHQSPDIAKCAERYEKLVR